MFRRCFGAVGLHKVGCGRSVSSSRSRRGGDADWYVRVCALETVDARGGSGRDQVYEERLRFAASLCVRVSPSPPRDEGAQGGVLCRRLVYGCAAVATRYAKIVLPTRLMGYACVGADVMLRARSRGRRALASGTHRRVSRWLRSVSRCIRGRVSQSASGLCGFSCPTASTTLSWHFSGLAYGLGCYSG